MKHLKLIMIFFGLTGLMSCKAQTQTPQQKAPSPQERGKKKPPTVEETFKMDINGDDLLSKSEIQGRLLKDFDKIDANKDEFISREELKNAPKPPRRGKDKKSN